MDFLKMYDLQRQNGLDCYRAFTYVAAKIAFYGSVEDLQDLYLHHLDDFLKETEEFMNEKDSIDQIKVG